MGLVAEHRHDHHVGLGSRARDLADEVDAVAVRQAQVDQRHVEVDVGDGLARRRHRIALGRQHQVVVARDGGADGFAEGVVVVDDQDAGRIRLGYLKGFGHGSLDQARGHL